MITKFSQIVKFISNENICIITEHEIRMKKFATKFSHTVFVFISFRLERVVVFVKRVGNRGASRKLIENCGNISSFTTSPKADKIMRLKPLKCLLKEHVIVINYKVPRASSTWLVKSR